VAVVGEVRAGSVGVDARRSLGGRRLISFASALGADTGEQRGRGLLGVGLTGRAGGTSMRGRRSAVSVSSGCRARCVRRGPAGGRSTGSSAAASLVGITAVAIGRGIGVDEAAAFAIGARAREPKRAADLRLVLKFKSQQEQCSQNV
jgi:hypothetical protein